MVGRRLEYVLQPHFSWDFLSMSSGKLTLQMRTKDLRRKNNENLIEVLLLRKRGPGYGFNIYILFHYYSIEYITFTEYLLVFLWYFFVRIFVNFTNNLLWEVRFTCWANRYPCCTQLIQFNVCMFHSLIHSFILHSFLIHLYISLDLNLYFSLMQFLNAFFRSSHTFIYSNSCWCWCTCNSTCCVRLYIYFCMSTILFQCNIIIHYIWPQIHHCVPFEHVIP